MRAEELFDGHLVWADGMARSAARKLPPSFDVDDLCQAARIGLWKASERYDPELNDNFHAYAQVYVQGEIWMSVRRGNYVEATHSPLPEGIETPCPGLDAEEGLHAACLGYILQEVLLTLSDGRELEVIKLHFLDGLSMHQVAERLGLGLTSCYLIRRAGLKNLHGMLLRRGVRLEDVA